MLTAFDEYSRHNGEKLPLPIQMQLFKKLKSFKVTFFVFLKITLNFEHIEKKQKKKTWAS